MGLTQNTKMKKSSKAGLTVVNWTLPAFLSKTGVKTCPNAGLCAAGCYARFGAYRFKAPSLAHERNLTLSQSDNFTFYMIQEINAWLEKKSITRLVVRIHDSGDFYSQAYFEKWLDVMAHFESDDKVFFYAYTKQVSMVKAYGPLPHNFRAIFSFGGLQDGLIDMSVDAHAKVFESSQDPDKAGYVDASGDDMVAALGKAHKIGLVYHGVKKYENTLWKKTA